MKNIFDFIRQDIKTSVVYGFALFAMFFGSGNLVFPIYVGYVAKYEWLSAFLGLFITAIFLPFLGLFVIKKYKGNYEKFLAQTGEIPKDLLILLLLSLLGSFGVLPRCIAVAYAGIEHVIPNVGFFLFSLIFCVVMFLSCLKETVMMKILAKWMSPILFISIMYVVCYGIYGYYNSDPKILPLSLEPKLFYFGFTTGYYTMDLIAAFFFSSLVFSQLESKIKAKKTKTATFIAFIKPSIIGCLLLAITYMGLVYIGAIYSEVIQDIPREKMLMTLISNILGSEASFVAILVVTFSCMSTAIALNNIYARYLHNMAEYYQLKHAKIIYALGFTSAMSFVMSFLDFSGIIQLLEPILAVIYPALIVLTIFSILFYNTKNINKVAFWFTIVYVAFFP